MSLARPPGVSPRGTSGVHLDTASIFALYDTISSGLSAKDRYC